MSSSQNEREDSRWWKEGVMGTKEKKQLTHERKQCLLVSHTHTSDCEEHVTQQNPMQNTLEKLTTKATNKVAVELLLRK